MRITKVYTRTGDAGKTRLAGGQVVWKDSPRVEAFGTVDELNAVLGVVRAFQESGAPHPQSAALLDKELGWIQNKLFDVGGMLATEPGRPVEHLPTISAADVARLEHLMDDCQKDLSPLREFILPGGGKVPALLHQGRTICRRAERRCLPLVREASADGMILKFLNRLSDTLFVLARWIASKHGETESFWTREGG